MIPELSIIIPIYNGARYLPKCLDSILKQEFRNIELILVNDGSTDDSLTICLKYKEKDSRIIIIDQANHGASHARNQGIEIAKGNYIAFVDCDDEISRETYQINLPLLIASPEIDVLQYPIFYNYGNSNQYFFTHPISNHKGARQILKLWTGNGLRVQGEIWNKIFKHDVFRNIRFPENMKECEDEYLIPDIIKNIERVYTSAHGIYYYYYRENSAIREKKTYEKCQNRLQSLIHLCRYAQEVKAEPCTLRLFSKLLTDYFTYNFMYPKQSWNNIQEDITTLNTYRFKDILKTPIGIKHKIKVIILKVIGIRLLTVIYKSTYP